MEVVIGIWILCGIIGTLVMERKGRSGFGGFLLGLLLGPLGVIIALVLGSDQAALDRRSIASGQQRKCPRCAELVKAEAIVCRHCGADLAAVVEQAKVEKSAADAAARRRELIVLAVFAAIIAVGVLANQLAN